MERIKIKISNQPFRVTEIYRMLRTNIEFTGIENKSIVLTSCTPGDGKSSVSFQLAYSLSQSGKRVLFIDADIRKSRLSQALGIRDGLLGLSHYLAGRNELRDCIYATNINSLFFIPTGVFPSIPTELLGNQRFEDLLTELKPRFDYIIIDSPPIGSVIDAAVIAKRCDASILVVSSNRNSRRLEQRAIEQLRLANPNILGVVLNRVDRSYTNYYNKYYGEYQIDPAKHTKERVFAR